MNQTPRTRGRLGPVAILVGSVVLIAVFLALRFSGVLFAAKPPMPLIPAAPQQSGTPSSSSAPSPSPTPGKHGVHVITVKFDYDFAKTPACTDKSHEHCADHFVVYDISGGMLHRAKLFTIPVPAGATGQVKDITATSPKLDFESGQHQLAVVAQEPNGIESQGFAATIWIVIP